MSNIFLNIFKFPTTRRPPLPVIFNLLNGSNKDEGTFVAGNIELGTWNMVCHIIRRANIGRICFPKKFIIQRSALTLSNRDDVLLPTRFC